MFTTERFFKKIWSVWLLVVILALMMTGVAPPFMAVPAILIIIVMTLWCINCAYRSEHFVSFANLRMFFNMSVAPMFASLLTLGVTYKKNEVGSGDFFDVSACARRAGVVDLCNGLLLAQ